MELREFTYVKMVADCGSFTKAAAKLFITQPALSNYINKVEEEVDFVFLPTWHTYKDITQVKVAEEELVLVAAGGYLKEEHFLDREKKIINWRETAKLPLVTLKKGHALCSSVDVLYKNAGIKPQIAFESHSNMLSYRLAAQGLGIAVIPEITLELMKGSMDAEVFHLSETPLTWEVYALYREGCYMGKVEWDFLEIARAALRERTKAAGDLHNA